MINEQVRYSRCISIITNILLWGYIMIQVCQYFIRACLELIRNRGWGVTEFYINYQAGYVRRGLVGEIIYQLTKSVPDIDPRWYIGGICLISLIVVISFLIKNFRKKSLCWWVLPLSVCLMGAYDWIRKDFLCVLLIICIFSAYSKIQNAWLRYIVTMLLLGVGLNVHECIFFMCVPFLLWAALRDTNVKFYCRCLSILTPLVLMAVVCIFKGNRDMALGIWRSWGIVFPEFSVTSPSCSLAAIGWETSYAVKFHIEANFITQSGIFYGWYSKPMSWCLIFYMIVNILYCRRDYLTNQTSLDVKFFISVFIFQFISLLPMFTVLSCDAGRVCFYWLVSTFCIYFTYDSSRGTDLWPTFYSSIVKKLQESIFSVRSVYVAVGLMLLFCISPNYTDAWNAFYSSVVGKYFYALKKVVEVIC